MQEQCNLFLHYCISQALPKAFFLSSSQQAFDMWHQLNLLSGKGSECLKCCQAYHRRLRLGFNLSFRLNWEQGFLDDAHWLRLLWADWTTYVNKTFRFSFYISYYSMGHFYSQYFLVKYIRIYNNSIGLLDWEKNTKLPWTFFFSYIET